MPAPKDTTPPATDNVQVRKLRQRKPQNLNPGAADMPQPRRTSAEVRAEKEKKALKKEAAAVKTKAAKARVDEIKEALRREQAEANTPVEPAKKVGGRKKNTPQTSGQGVQPKAGPKPTAASSATETAISSATPVIAGESTVSVEERGDDDAMAVDELQDPVTLDKNFQAPADSRDRKVRLMAALQNHRIPSNNIKTGPSAPNNLSLPKAAASTLTNKPRGLSKGWFEKEGPITVTASQRYAQYVPPASPEAHPEHPAMLKEPQPSTALVHVKSHARPVTKAKKERARRNVLANIPGHLKARYVSEFQPAFIHTAITTSMDPWTRLPIEDVQELFSLVFPEITHEIASSDIFHSPAQQQTSKMRNHIKEAAILAVHHAMENRSPSARKHLAVKAEKYKKEFPFIYRHHEVTNMPGRHAEGSEVVRREGPWLSPIICETLAAYYHEVGLALPEPSFGPETDLEVDAPSGAYALCAVAVQRALHTYSTGDFITTKDKFEETKHGKTTRKLIQLLHTQDYQTWNAIFAQVARIGEDMKKRLKKARGASQQAAEDDSDDELEVLPSNVTA